MALSTWLHGWILSPPSSLTTISRQTRYFGSQASVTAFVLKLDTIYSYLHFVELDKFFWLEVVVDSCELLIYYRVGQNRLPIKVPILQSLAIATYRNLYVQCGCTYNLIGSLFWPTLYILKLKILLLRLLLSDNHEQRLLYFKSSVKHWY